MFKPNIIVLVSIFVASGQSACTIVSSNQAGQAGSAGATEDHDALFGIGGASSGGASGGGATSAQGGIAGSAALSCDKEGPVDASTIWEPIAGCPDGFDVADFVEISGTGTSLTIQPGVKLKFASGAGIRVNSGASLVAVGTADSPITFTGWQKSPGSWGGITVRSGAIKNEISYAIVEYGGESGGASAAIVLTKDSQYGTLRLTNTQIRNSAKFGLTVYTGCSLTAFENNTITANGDGAIRVEAPSVHQLVGKGNSITSNGNGNVVRIETNSLMPIADADVTWPNLSPAVYRVTEPGGSAGNQLFIKRHVTIEAGAVFEFLGGSGIDVTYGSSGISAIGTAAAPIIFRGVDGSGWTGIGICESGWTGNALEEVEIANAAGSPSASYLCGSGAPGVLRPSILVGHNFGANASKLRIKNLKMTGPNNAPSDILVRSPSTLTLEGTNSGTRADGALAVQSI